MTQSSDNEANAFTKSRDTQKTLSQNFLASINSEQAIVLRQSPHWSRAMVWTIIGVTTATMVWASIATIEQVVQAQGQLKPQGATKEIHAPINGVVEKVLIEDGNHVKKGQKLVAMHSESTVAQLGSLRKVKESLEQENKFYRILMAESPASEQIETPITEFELPIEVAALALNRTALIRENQLYQMQLGQSIPGAKLQPDQTARLRAAKKELSSRAMAARLEMEQLQKQLRQTQVQLTDAKNQVNDAQKVLDEIKNRNTETIKEAKKGLKIEQKILADVKLLLEEGALARHQVERQYQSVADRRQRLIEQTANGIIEYDRQKQELQNRQAEIARFQEEEQRLELAISQARARLTNTIVLSEKAVRDSISDNKKRVAEIDSQLTKVIIENNKRIAELNSEISRTKVTLKYQDIIAPVSGTIFDLNARPGYVTPPNQTEPLLKIVPDDSLLAKVNVTNEDIGFVRTGQKVDIRIDSFPFSEFGDIKGEVISIASDVLEPDEIHRFYRFPTKIKLDQQFLRTHNREIPLQSGMSVTVNIKVRENRTVISLMTELFRKKVESLKQVR